MMERYDDEALMGSKPKVVFRGPGVPVDGIQRMANVYHARGSWQKDPEKQCYAFAAKPVCCG